MSSTALGLNQYSTTMRSPRRKKILLVDDSRTVQFAARMILTDYDVVTAGDGDEALQRAMVDTPDLVLLDVMMPKVDGFQTCRRLRAHRNMKDLPIIMVTTRGEPQNVEAGYQSGCNEYVTKPFDAAELLALIRSLVGE